MGNEAETKKEGRDRLRGRCTEKFVGNNRVCRAPGKGPGKGEE